MKNKWKNIIIHCSDSVWGSEKAINKWHTEKGWSDTGYHFIVANGYPVPGFYLPAFDGSLEIGRKLDGSSFVDKDEIGAHALGYNSNSIGVCLIGKDIFSSKQVITLTSLIQYLCQRFNINYFNILGHTEVDSSKSCPNIDMNKFRKQLNIWYK